LEWFALLKKKREARIRIIKNWKEPFGTVENVLLMQALFEDGKL